MILFHPTSFVPPHLRKKYFLLRGVLISLFIIFGGVFVYKGIFPSQHFAFSFEKSDTAKNTFGEPRDQNGNSLEKGRIQSGATFRTFAGTGGTFSSVRVSLVLENDSPLPKEPVAVSLRRSYRAFFHPQGDPLESAPKERGFAIADTRYLFSGESLSPFLSKRVALSYFPEKEFVPANEDLLKIFPPKEEVVGFRPGSLISDAEGVYAIDSDNKAHPIGSVAVFEALGFDEKQVIRADEEEVRNHKRGEAFLFDAAQPEGTLFLDKDTGTYSLIEQGKKREIKNKAFLDSLLAVTAPIAVSGNAMQAPATCMLKKTWINPRPTYACDLPIEALKNFPGGSFELSLQTKEDIHAALLSATFETKPTRGNLSAFIERIKDRFSAVYGGT